MHTLSKLLMLHIHMYRAPSALRRDVKRYVHQARTNLHPKQYHFQVYMPCFRHNYELKICSRYAWLLWYPLLYLYLRHGSIGHPYVFVDLLC